MTVQTAPNIQETLAGRRPGYSLERMLYTSAEVHEADLRRIFFKNWLFAGHISRIPNRGDYFTAELGDESIIVIRGEQGEVHGLLNVCRHRGSRICTRPEGTARTLVCPYHQWAYATDGRLLKARLMDGLDAESHGLHKVHLQVLAGLIFICLADTPPEFEGFRRAMEPRLRHHGLESAKICKIARYELKANWKLVIENSRECYHCGGAHPQYCKAVGFAAAIGSEQMAMQEAAITEEQKARLKGLGLETEEVPFLPESWYHYRRFSLRPGAVTESVDGKPVAPLMGNLPDWETGAFAIVTLPSLLLEANSDYVMALSIVPLGAQLTRAEVTWLVRDGARECVDYDVERVTEFWRLTSEQDWRLCEDNQLGVISSRYEPGPYGSHERGVEHFAQWYVRQMRKTECEVA